MELTDFNAQHNHNYTEEDRYVVPKQPEVRESLEAFQDRKFGVMVTWGTYSQWGIVESWALPDEDRSWAWHDMDKRVGSHEFRERYLELVKTFNPVRFRPDDWAKTFRDAGFQYLIFITKHHDGFSLWDTQYSDYKITSPECPYSRNPNADICKVLFDACREEGIKIHAYFSKPDWHSPYYWAKGFSKDEYMTRNPSYNIEQHPELWEKFREYTRSQLLELVEKYGRLECLWLDGGQVNPANGQDIRLSEIMEEARKMQPWLMAADRTVGGENENFITPEQLVPDHVIHVPWESYITLGTSFSYKFDDEYKDARTVIHMLCDIVAKGGNLALNVGPRPDGLLPAPALPILAEIGAWLRRNGEAIYGTRPAAPYREGNFAYTGKNGQVYAIYLAPANEKMLPSILEIPVEGHVEKVSFQGKAMEFTQEGRILRVMTEPGYDPEPAYVFTLSK